MYNHIYVHLKKNLASRTLASGRQMAIIPKLIQSFTLLCRIVRKKMFTKSTHFLKH